MGYVSTRMGDCLSALLMSLMALRLALFDRNPFGLVKTNSLPEITVFSGVLYLITPSILHKPSIIQTYLPIIFLLDCLS